MVFYFHGKSRDLTVDRRGSEHIQISSAVHMILREFRNVPSLFVTYDEKDEGCQPFRDFQKGKEDVSVSVGQLSPGGQLTTEGFNNMRFSTQRTIEDAGRRYAFKTSEFAE